jgi:hypothetical protein
VEEMTCIPDEDEDEVPAPRVPEDKEEEVPRRPPEEDDVGGVLAVKRPRASRFCVAALWRLPLPRPFTLLRPHTVDPSVQPFTPLRSRVVDPSVRALPPPRPRAEDLSLLVLPPRPLLTWVALERPLDPPPALTADPSTPAIRKMGKMGNGGDGDA